VGGEFGPPGEMLENRVDLLNFLGIKWEVAKKVVDGGWMTAGLTP